MAHTEGKGDLDLPLHSNIEDIRIAHYIIDLTCDIQNKQFIGNIILVIASEDFSDCSHIESSRKVPCNRLMKIDTTGNKIKDNQNFERPNICQNKASNCEYAAEDSENSFSLIETKSTNNKILLNQAKEREVSTKQNSYCDWEIRKTKCDNHDICIENIKEENADQNNCIVGLAYDSKFQHSCVKDMCNVSTNISPDTDSVDCDNTYSGQCKTKNASTRIIDESDKVIGNVVSKTCQNFVFILDAWDITVTSVHEIILRTGLDLSHKANKTRLRDLIQDCVTDSLEYYSEKTCLKIWRPGITTSALFPRCIRISYQTQPCGPSLKWTKDQDGRPCVYTHGHWINNRSLFPSQDVPGALSTWQAYIHVPDEMTVLMSGDTNPVIICSLSGTDMTTYLYHTDLDVPSSTLALAVGYWEEVEIISPNTGSSIPYGQLPCRLFTPKCHKELASSILCSYVPRCMESAVSLFGPHPFKRLDILIVPASFASLGMASPSLMFLSQSVLSQDGHMLVRVSHELSHSWFGLAIGPRDWHEEWLSEGFATYAEFLIHERTAQLTEEEFREERDINDYLKYRTLQAELQSTDKDLQMLRNADVDDNRQAYVSNGMNPDKGFLQLHYLKGYFLLRHLEDTVGFIHFKDFLKKFIKQFKHSLIDSMDVIQLFFKMFPNVRSVLSEKAIFDDWLNCPGLPKTSVCCSLRNNKMNDKVIDLEKSILDCHKSWTKLHWRKRRKLDIESKLHINNLKQVQILLLLDRLLEYEHIHNDILQHLNKTFMLSITNADVQHKWCELVIRHKFREYYGDVRQFLVQHQAMGVYLFGELIISRDKAQRNLAEDVFTSLADDMEEGVRKVVRTMIYGS